MKQLILLSLLISFSQLTSAQTNDCFENSDGFYWPVKVGLKRNFKSGNKNFTSNFKGDSIEFKGKYYLTETKEYSNGDSKTSYWREENGAVYNFKKEKGEESSFQRKIFKFGNQLTSDVIYSKYRKFQ